MSPSAPTRRNLLLGIVLGLLVFAAGVALATAFLPEWRAGMPKETKAAFRERYRELAARAGLSLEPGEPRVYLSTSSRQGYGNLETPREGAASPRAARRSVRVEVFHPARGPKGWKEGNLGMDFSLDGQPRLVTWWRRSDLFEIPDAEQAGRFARTLAPLLLQPGESTGAVRRDFLGSAPRLRIAIQGSSPVEHLLVFASSTASAIRLPGTLDETETERLDTTMSRVFTGVFGRALVLFLLLGLFVVLTLGSRIGALNGALLALLALVTLNPLPDAFLGAWSWSAVTALSLSARIFLLWCCAESLLRSTAADFTTSLDALRAGRLGPRGGRALLLGLGFGGAVAGLRLALLSLASVLPGVRLVPPTIQVPFFSAYSSPVASGIGIAGGVALALALALRVLPLRWAPAAAALVAGALFLPIEIHPFPAGMAAGSVLAGLLVYVVRRHGLTALLTASLVSAMLPAAVFAAQHLEWMAGGLAATALPLAALGLLGWAGLSRSATREVERLSTPAFVRRLEEERRLRNEMDLLARMQRGLLPRTLPRLDGYEIAARSILANEAGGDLYDALSDDQGRFWLAAGDVAGHGYSCAIAQAMTKAALGSLIGKGRSPAAVLQRMDGVLRAAGAKRNFTSLALLRCDLATGEAVLGNAGHPYPLLVSGGEARELPVPGARLPLGQGPARIYQDLSFRLEPGAALVFCSDGLFEAQDGDGALYGFDRARSVLRVASKGDAPQILEAVLADWRHHLRGARPLDDTTVVVLKRAAGGPEP